MSIAVTQARLRLPKRFSDKVDFDGLLIPGMTARCWFWMASRDSYGHGQYSEKGKLLRAHRYAYIVVIGVPPDGTELHHRCEIPPCVNPFHLKALTRKEHMALGVNMPRDFCIYGHPLSGDNLYVSPRGYRQCRKCVARSQREYQARKRVAT
jgi:hypothetical protein